MLASPRPRTDAPSDHRDDGAGKPGKKACKRGDAAPASARAGAGSRARARWPRRTSCTTRAAPGSTATGRGRTAAGRIDRARGRAGGAPAGTRGGLGGPGGSGVLWKRFRGRARKPGADARKPRGPSSWGRDAPAGGRECCLRSLAKERGDPRREHASRCAGEGRRLMLNRPHASRTTVILRPGATVSGVRSPLRDLS